MQFSHYQVRSESGFSYKKKYIQNVVQFRNYLLQTQHSLKRSIKLSHEKKRLKQELEELQTEYDEIKPTTPTGTTDWYVKWMSMLLAVAGIFLISASLTFYGQLAYIVSCVGWIYVGMQWGDRAIMIGSAVSCTAIAMNLVNTFT